jgi:hypothetical protein
METTKPDSTALVALNLPLIKVVGISASGKSTLVKALRQRGYQARPISQEHSNIPSLWQQFEPLRLLFYLDVDLETQRARRPDVTWDKHWMTEETERLRHAHDHADLIINTSGLSPETVLQIALTFLQNENIRHADHPLPSHNATGSALQPKAANDEAAPTTDIVPPTKTKLRSNRTQRRLDKRSQKQQERR